MLDFLKTAAQIVGSLVIAIVVFAFFVIGLPILMDGYDLPAMNIPEPTVEPMVVEVVEGSLLELDDHVYQVDVRLFVMVLRPKGLGFKRVVWFGNYVKLNGYGLYAFPKEGTSGDIIVIKLWRVEDLPEPLPLPTPVPTWTPVAP